MLKSPLMNFDHRIICGTAETPRFSTPKTNPYENMNEWVSNFYSNNSRSLISNIHIWIDQDSCTYIRTDTKKNWTEAKMAIDICFSSDFDESWWDCSTDEYYNMTNFHQYWMKNTNFLLHAWFWLCPIFFVSDLTSISLQ